MRLGPLLEGPRQFVVPYFQRAYSWRRRQWTTLLDDVLEYDQILHPQRESDAEVRKQLQRLTAWSKTVAYLRRLRQSPQHC